ncbi:MULTISPECIES: hypothetical protein [Xanthomonas]|nr:MULTISPECIES: hypothetical protein [Xanthomonas]MCC8548122.1 hypothetical protein [Xanthomonas perforans]MCC8563526.1 hypothetical protein [Xanthomonas perforans]MCC8836821.1 hypothetical protein [Xanthomonas perforans]MCF5947893.1 hypothetical protein [Xanthomonas perforans]MCF5962842.1 hypothetical protein [Xanthomonas perforans]
MNTDHEMVTLADYPVLAEIAAGERIAEARATLDGEQAPFATFAAVLFDYLRLPVMAGPVTARHAEIDRHRAMTAALKAPIQSARRH